MVLKLKTPGEAAGLFVGRENVMLRACFLGIAGQVYGERRDAPRSALAVAGDFWFFGGEASEELAAFRPSDCGSGYRILVPESREWEQRLEKAYGNRAKKFTRYATKREPDAFDREKLRRAADSLPPGYSVRRINRELFFKCRQSAWCRDLVSQYETYERYETYGLGVAAVKDGEIVSGASSYAGCGDGIEIEIDTRKDQRRRGLAYACASRLILDCLDRGWYPEWDAHNLASLGLAEKLGYRLACEYTAYETEG